MTLTSPMIELVSDLSQAEISRRIASLLSAEGVDFTATDSGISSTSTPLALLGFQREMYSRSNWLGLNPFAHVTAINVSWRTVDAKRVAVCVRINRTRAVAFAGIAMVLGLVMVAPMLPTLGAVLLAIAVGLFAWGEIDILGKRLIISEIGRALSPGVAIHAG